MSNVTVQEALKAAIDAMEIEGIGSCDAAQQCRAAISEMDKCQPFLIVGEYMPLKMADILRSIPYGTKL